MNVRIKSNLGQEQKHDMGVGDPPLKTLLAHLLHSFFLFLIFLKIIF